MLVSSGGISSAPMLKTFVCTPSGSNSNPLRSLERDEYPDAWLSEREALSEGGGGRRLAVEASARGVSCGSLGLLPDGVVAFGTGPGRSDDDSDMTFSDSGGDSGCEILRLLAGGIGWSAMQLQMLSSNQDAMKSLLSYIALAQLRFNGRHMSQLKQLLLM